MFVPLIVAIYPLRLKLLLIIDLAFVSFCGSQISTYIIAMSDLGNALTIWGYKARVILLNMVVCKMTSSIWEKKIGLDELFL